MNNTNIAGNDLQQEPQQPDMEKIEMKLKPRHCHQCGLPFANNPHPDAGKPEKYLEVGVAQECVPCLVLSRHQWSQRALSAERKLRELETQQASQQKPLHGTWYHGNGALCCGTFRIARADFDTNPTQERQTEVFDWICSVLNAAQPAAPQQPVDMEKFNLMRNEVLAKANDKDFVAAMAVIEQLALYKAPGSGIAGMCRDVINEMEVKQETDSTELKRLRDLLNTPEFHDFAKGVTLEAAHQRERWGTDYDDGKEAADWFWLIGYLAQKAMMSQIAGNTDKALHHTISTAAACANWHSAISGANTRMRPGIPTPTFDVKMATEGRENV